jgi:Ca-activated chloride channel family protein
VTVYSRKILLACVALVACERARKAPDDAAPPPIDLPPRTEALELVIVFDLSKSMEENDLPPDRLDATRAALRAFAATRTRDRIGVVIYAQQPKLVLAPTADLKAVDAVLARLKIGDVPELGTAMGDGLALAVEQLPRSKAKRAVILTTDGDTNWVTRYDPAQAADLAKAAGITVHTVLVGSNQPTAFGTVSVNPVPVKQVAITTGGLFVQATDPAAFKAGLAAISAKLDAR